MFEIHSGNLEQGAECFAAQLAHPNCPTSLDPARSGLSGPWSLAGLLWAGVVACLLIQ